MTEPTDRRIAVAAALGLVPMALALTLTFLRPDLMRPMLHHVFGFVISAVELTLVLAGVVVYVAAGIQTRGSARVGLQIAAFILCTLPAVILVLFGPIIFAFMFGNMSEG